MRLYSATTRAGRLSAEMIAEADHYLGHGTLRERAQRARVARAARKAARRAGRVEARTHASRLHPSDELLDWAGLAEADWQTSIAEQRSIEAQDAREYITAYRRGDGRKA